MRILMALSVIVLWLISWQQQSKLVVCKNNQTAGQLIIMSSVVQRDALDTIKEWGGKNEIGMEKLVLMILLLSDSDKWVKFIIHLHLS